MNNSFLSLLFFFAFLLTCSTCVVASEQEKVTLTIPGPLNGQMVRNPFIEELLQLIFLKENKVLNIQYVAREFTKGRALKELASGDFFDLNWSATSIQVEQELLPIRIPIYQGLIGWRVLLVKQGNEQRFKDINTIVQLRSLVAVQRFDWEDYHILKENGLQVEGSLSFDNHSFAVRDGVADYFPRSVLEVVRESKSPQNSQLVIEPTLLIKYPSANYFFVKNTNIKLARIIESGFEKSLSDGSYMALFNKHFGKILSGLSLERRRVIDLNNSQFPVKEYKAHHWYRVPQ